MNLSSQTQAVLLLTISFGVKETSSAKPLSRSEWARFSKWLKDHDLDPSALLQGEIHSLLSGLVDKAISADRIQSLLNRGAALGLSLEKWDRTGLWVITPTDPDYPKRLKQRLMHECPAVLFGCGSKNLLDKGGLAVVGSRDANDEDLGFTSDLGKQAAEQGHSIVSGGAHGVDQSAMLGTLESEGTAIGVMADSLLKTSTSGKYRKKIMSGDLTLISAFNPEAGFNVGNAMARNKYIYCMAETAVIVTSTFEKGGTWNGAVEAIDAGWVPVWVKKTEKPNSGNPKLVERGAIVLPGGEVNIDKLIEGDSPGASTPVDRSRTDQGDNSDSTVTSSKVESEKIEITLRTNATSLDLFDFFILKAQSILNDGALDVEEISNRLELTRNQTNSWLRRGLAEGRIEKLSNPVRYRVVKRPTTQKSLF